MGTKKLYGHGGAPKMTSGDGDPFVSPKSMQRQQIDYFADMGMEMVSDVMEYAMGGKEIKMKKGGAVKKKKKQGYNARLDESMGMRNRGKKKQSMKSRRKESKGMEKAMGRKSYSGNRSSAQGRRKKK